MPLFNAMPSTVMGMVTVVRCCRRVDRPAARTGMSRMSRLFIAKPHDFPTIAVTFHPGFRRSVFLL